MRINVVYIMTLLVLLSCRTDAPVLDQAAFATPTPLKTAWSKKDMVVSAHPLATAAGVKILEQGGNAFDAAVAVQFALAVVLPAAGNIGGGGFMVAKDAKGEFYALDYREKAPLTASRDMYLDEEGNVVPNLSRQGHLAAGVPGTVDGMVQLFDSLSALTDWSALVEPAIELAERGFVITEVEAGGLNRKAEIFAKFNDQSCPFLRDDEWTVGDTLIQTELASTLRAISDQGRAGFYSGQAAEQLVAEMKSGNGLISQEDLDAYRAIWRKPIKCQYKDYDVVSMPPPSSGGIALCQLLGIVEDYPIEKWGRRSAETMHLIIEAERRVYADRAEHLGDADYYPVPVSGLIDRSYVDARMSDFNPQRASSSSEISAGEPATESEETTHYSIVDKDGNAVSMTTTLNGGYGSCVWVDGAGYILNNEMDDFSAKPGEPNLYGLIGNEANAIQPSKRMLSSMTPSLVLRNDSLKMVVGTPGGSTIITSVFQCVTDVLAHGMSMSEAVSSPRYHHQWKPDMVFYEKDGLTTELINELSAMGHTLKERGGIGKVDAIKIYADGRLEGAADPRADDHAQSSQATDE